MGYVFPTIGKVGATNYRLVVLIQVLSKVLGMKKRIGNNRVVISKLKDRGLTDKTHVQIIEVVSRGKLLAEAHLARIIAQAQNFFVLDCDYLD